MWMEPATTIKRIKDYVLTLWQFLIFKYFTMQWFCDVKLNILVCYCPTFNLLHQIVILPSWVLQWKSRLIVPPICAHFSVSCFQYCMVFCCLLQDVTWSRQQVTPWSLCCNLQSFELLLLQFYMPSSLSLACEKTSTHTNRRVKQIKHQKRHPVHPGIM